MKKNILMSVVFVLFAQTSLVALADVKVRGGVAPTTYKAEFTNMGVFKMANSQYMSANLGMTYVFEDGVYLDVSGSGGSGTHDNYVAIGARPQNFKRSDFALIAGKSDVSSSGRNYAIFAGLKAGTTLLGAPKGLPGIPWSETSFSEAGFVFGGGMSFPLDTGAVGVSIGLGFMGAKFSNNDTGIINTSDSASSVSLGANYNYPISPVLGLLFDFKLNSYSANFTKPNSTTYTVKEGFSSLGASLTAKF